MSSSFFDILDLTGVIIRVWNTLLPLFHHQCCLGKVQTQTYSIFPQPNQSSTMNYVSFKHIKSVMDRMGSHLMSSLCLFEERQLSNAIFRLHLNCCSHWGMFLFTETLSRPSSSSSALLLALRFLQDPGIPDIKKICTKVGRMLE